MMRFHRSARSRRAWLLAGALVLPAGAARAVNCTVTPTTVAFGNYDPSSPVALTTTGSVAVSCSALVLASTPYVMSLSSGDSGSMSMRAMVSGSSRLQYQLYSDLLHTIVLGDGSGGSTTLSGTVTAALGSGTTTTTIYAQIAPGQLATPGAYSDTILVTISF